MYIRNDLAGDALLQENLALKEKVKSLMKMLKKDRLKIKDLEAKIYENSVDMEIEKELNNTLKKETWWKSKLLEVKMESDLEEVLVDDEDRPGHGSGEEDYVEEGAGFLMGKYPAEELGSEEIDVEKVDLKTKAKQNPAFLDELQEIQSSLLEMEEIDEVLENETNGKTVENPAEISNLENKPDDVKTRSSENPSTDEAGTKTFLEKNSIQCNQCNFKHRSQAHVKVHIKSMHEGYRWKCDGCGKEFTSPYKMNEHMKLKHHMRPGTTEAKEITAVNCKLCNKFITQNNLKRHMRKRHESDHQKDKEVSKAEIKSSDLLSSNTKTQKGEKIHKCSQCNYASNRADNLKMHLKRHSGEKPNKCNQCNYASFEASNLKKHATRHSGEKSDLLSIDLKTQSRKKIHKCNHCDYVSSWSSNLEKHLKRHIGENKKSNEIDQLNFTSSDNLMAHVIIHGKKLASEAERNPQQSDTEREVMKEGSKEVALQIANLDQDEFDKNKYQKNLKKTSSKFIRVSCEKCSLEMNETSLSRHMVKQHPEPR